MEVWVGAEITVNVTLPPLSIIHFQSSTIPGFARQLGDDASKMGSIAEGKTDQTIFYPLELLYP